MPGREQMKFNFGPGGTEPEAGGLETPLEAFESELEKKIREGRVQKAMERDPGLSEAMARRVVDITIKREKAEEERRKKAQKRGKHPGVSSYIDPLLK